MIFTFHITLTFTLYYLPMKLPSEKILTIFNRHNFTDLWTMELFENIALREIRGYSYGV